MTRRAFRERGTERSPTDIVALYVGAIAAAELVLVFANVLAGMLMHVVLLTALLIHHGLREDRPPRTPLAPLALVPMLRILSLTMPVPTLSPTIWLILITLPLVAAALGVARQADLQLSTRMWRQRRFWLLQGGIAASGVVAAALIVLLGQPSTPADESLAGTATRAALLFLCVGVAEEVVFRGVIQPALGRRISSGMAIGLTSILFATVYLGSLSLGHALLAAAMGVWFGVCALRSGSIIGTSVSHGLVAVAIALAIPGAGIPVAPPAEPASRATTPADSPSASPTTSSSAEASESSPPATSAPALETFSATAVPNPGPSPTPTATQSDAFGSAAEESAGDRLEPSPTASSPAVGSPLPSASPTPAITSGPAPTPTIPPTSQPSPSPTPAPTASPEPSAAPTPQCSDGVDNDGDLLIDFPLDLGCASPTDDDESGLGL